MGSPALVTISIHLMFLLITEILKRYPYWTVISIHLMFLLIKPDIAGKELQRHISIHLMFLLITILLQIRLYTQEFQYISCFY